jgi:CDP-glucose 4,6-dehydratase
VRNPDSTRPWQHVLEPLSGYLSLAAGLARPATRNPQLASAFNFGPAHESNRTVRELVTEVLKHWPGKWKHQPEAKAVHEAKLLQLCTDKARTFLGWSPVWNFSLAMEFTMQWYRRAEKKSVPAVIQKLTTSQIWKYCAAARKLKIPWALN